MYSFLSKHGQLIALGLGALITIVFFIIIGANGSTFSNLESEGLKLREYNSKLSETGIFNFGLVATLFLVAATAIAVVLFSIIGVVTDFKNSKKGLMGFGVLLLVFVISWFAANSMGDGDGVLKVIEKMNQKNDAGITAGISSFITASLISTIFVGAAAAIGLVVSEVMNLFR